MGVKRDVWAMDLWPPFGGDGYQKNGHAPVNTALRSPGLASFLQPLFLAGITVFNSQSMFFP